MDFIVGAIVLVLIFFSLMCIESYSISSNLDWEDLSWDEKIGKTLKTISVILFIAVLDIVAMYGLYLTAKWIGNIVLQTMMRI